MTEFGYHGAVFRAEVYLEGGGPGLAPYLTIEPNIKVVGVECHETWADFSKLTPQEYLDVAADDPEFVEAAIEAAEYDRDPY